MFLPALPRALYVAEGNLMVEGPDDGQWLATGTARVSQQPATLLAEEGLTALEHGVDVGIACTCAEGVGAIDRTMQLTAEYLNTRKQFGVTLSTFQALRHRMADMKMQQELARSMSYYASLKLNAPAEERRRAMARAKYQLGLEFDYDDVGFVSLEKHGTTLREEAIRDGIDAADFDRIVRPEDMIGPK